MTDEQVVRCQHKVLSRHWQRCPHPARFVIRGRYDEMLVCGVHRRGWLPVVIFQMGEAASLPATAMIGQLP